ncbi:MAG: hypothetical protein KDN18_01340 [Verrucomicrobiae bacterium]|nr:hypothetical protein [Verrucomicrobiae bacterium]
MKLVQKSLTSLLSVIYLLIGASFSSLSAQDNNPPHLAHYDPTKGFKPAQANLTEIFLQIAGSLECHGSPEPYLRHIQSEHARVSQLYKEKTGKKHAGRMPTHMSAAYVDLMVKNWNTLSSPLQLEPFAKEIGRCAREGIMGTRLGGTYAVQIFNEHQRAVAARMKGQSNAISGFEELRQRMEKDLLFGKLGGSAEGLETSRRDAVSYALTITDRFWRKSEEVRSIAEPAKAAEVNQGLKEFFLDLGYLAQSELEIGILESALRQL